MKSEAGELAARLIAAYGQKRTEYDDIVDAANSTGKTGEELDELIDEIDELITVSMVSVQFAGAES